MYFCRMSEHIEDPLCLELQALGLEEAELCLEEMLNEVKYFEVEEEVRTLLQQQQLYSGEM